MNTGKLFLLCLLLTASNVMPAAAEETLTKSTKVKASPEEVVKAIVKFRTVAPANRRIIEHDESKAVIKEKMKGSIPIASDVVTYEESVRSNHRVDYKMIEAKKLSKFQGSWMMEKGDKPGYTNVSLITTVDSSLLIPFKGRILRNEASKIMDQRINFVKQEAERFGTLSSQGDATL